MRESYLAKYLRISDDDEDIGGGKRESNSIVNQRRLLDSFIMQDEGLSKYPVKEFVDDGVSGVTFQRPGVQQMLSEVRDGNIHCIIVKDLSRFGRNYIEVGDYIEQIFPFLGVRFISVSDNFDSSQKAAGLEIGFKNLMHDLYSRDLSRKVKSVKALMQKRGIYSGGDVPYGYVRNDGEGAAYIPDSEAAEVVKRIFTLAAEGNTTTKIADRLNAEGIPIPGEYKNCRTNNNYQLKNGKRRLWSSSQIGIIIQNEVYVGTFIGRKLSTVRPGEIKKNDKSEYVKIENHHEKLVDEQQFNKAQTAIRVCRKRRQYQKEEHSSVLKGKVKCGCCGYGMSLKRTSKREYYYCRMGNSCGSHNQIEKELLEGIIKEILQKLVITYEGHEKAYQSENVRILTAISKWKEQKRCLEINTDHCRVRRLELYYQWKEGRLGKEDYILKKDELTRKEKEYLVELELLEQRLTDASSFGKEERQEKQLEVFAGTQKLTKELVEGLIERIEIYSDNRVEIHWKFKL